MTKMLVAFAIVGMTATAALSQTPAPADAAPVEKPKTVTKVVCEKVSAEQETGSRLGATGKICRKVQVPVTKEVEAEQPNAGHGSTGR